MTYRSDYFDVPICAGDRVVYPVRQGSRMWMVDGYVVAVGDSKIQVEVEGQKPSWVTCLKRVVVIP